MILSSAAVGGPFRVVRCRVGGATGQVGGDVWKNSNKTLCDLLVNQQRQDVDQRGALYLEVDNHYSPLYVKAKTASLERRVGMHVNQGYKKLFNPTPEIDSIPDQSVPTIEDARSARYN